MRITGLYAALSTFLVLILGVRVMLYRRAHKIGLGDGDDGVTPESQTIEALSPGKVDCTQFRRPTSGVVTWISRGDVPSSWPYQ